MDNHFLPLIFETCFKINPNTPCTYHTKNILEQTSFERRFKSHAANEIRLDCTLSRLAPHSYSIKKRLSVLVL